MALAHFSILIYEFLNKDSDIVPEESPLIIFYSKSSVCMDNNGKGTKHTSHIARRVNFVRNGEKFNMQKIDWCEGNLKLADISIKSVGEHNLTPRMKYIIVTLEN